MAKNRYASRKLAAGYLGPSERQGCRSCRHRGTEAISFNTGGAPAYDCLLGGFLVSLGGICQHYQLAGVAGTHTKGSPCSNS